MVALQCKCTMNSTEVNGTKLITRKILHYPVCGKVLKLNVFLGI